MISSRCTMGLPFKRSATAPCDRPLEELGQDGACTLKRHLSEHDAKEKGIPDRALSKDVQVIERMVLQPELLQSAHWRHQGPRLLTKLQSKHQVNVRFDKQRGLLQLSGSEFDVSAAKELVANLGGQKKTLKAPVKAELLRAKTMEGSQSTMKWLRRQSSCAFHVDQSGKNVSIVGHSEDVKVAEKLLEELAERCVEEVVPTNGAHISVQAVEAIESSCGVTIQTKEDNLVVLGLRDSVKKAVVSVHLMIEKTRASEEVCSESSGCSICQPTSEATTAGTGEEDTDCSTPTSAVSGDGATNDAKEEYSPIKLKKGQPEWAKPILHFFNQLKVKDAPDAYCP